MHGKLGGLVFRRCGDHLIVTRMPKNRSRTPSPAETANRDRFKLAAAYGRSVLSDPVAKAIYLATAKEKRISLSALCVADYLKRPVVEAIDLSHYTGKAGQTIRIAARDNFEVVDVTVAITTKSGQLVERGFARYDLITRNWVYTTSSAVPESLPSPVAGPIAQQLSIEATASDRPGNKTSRVEWWVEGGGPAMG